MSENEKKDETILDIIDIMQDFDCEGGWCDSMEDLAGRLREAWERHLKKEQEDRLSLQHTIAELTKSIADAGETIEAQKAKLVELFNRTGNVAKLREALETCLCLFETIPHVLVGTTVREKVEAALAEPPRSCDMFGGDYKMLHTAWFDWTGSPSGQNANGTAKLTFGKWLLAPANKKGGAK